MLVLAIVLCGSDRSRRRRFVSQFMQTQCHDSDVPELAGMRCPASCKHHREPRLHLAALHTCNFIR